MWPGRPDEQLQPVLIGADSNASNGARNIALADGIWRDEALTFERVFLLFDEDQIDGARAAWRTLAQKSEIERRYWKQDDAGKWTRER